MQHYYKNTSERSDESSSQGLVIDGMLVARIWDPAPRCEEETPFYFAILCNMDREPFYFGPYLQSESLDECKAWALNIATLALEA